MFTLKILKSGNIKPEDLGPEKRFKIAEGLTEFPRELFELADHIEVLDMSGNNLSELPSDFGRFKNLKILFLSNNQFDHIPDVIADCPNLEMIGFKSNQIKTISESALPIKTRWLILTDNQISKLPDSIGQLSRLQKLALAGNQISSLPDAMANCRNLELIRLSANQLEAMPDWLFQLPKLAWLAFSGNPCTAVGQSLASKVAEAKLSDIQLLDQIGAGASGVIHKANWKKEENPIAVKLFKGSVTSDGYPQDELDCCLAAGGHENLIKVIGFVPDPKQLGLLMELIPNTYSNLGLPPSLETCTRDTFEDGTKFNVEYILRVLKQMASTIKHLHQQCVSHGDIYAHNILINDESNILFGDFGAATHLVGLPIGQRQGMAWIEVRALANLLEDLLLNIDSGLSSSDQMRFEGLMSLLLWSRSNNVKTQMGINEFIERLLAV